MNQDEILYILELLDEAINDQNWELVEESRDNLKDFLDEKNSTDSTEDL